MIKANEAKTIANGATVLQTILAAIDDRIRIAAKHGSTELIYDIGQAIAHRDELIKELEASGYKVTLRYASDFYISWR